LDRTGLLARITESAVLLIQGRKWLDTERREGAGGIIYRKGLALALDAFKEVQRNAADELETLIIAEYAFLGQERQFSSPSDTKTIASLNTASRSFDEALIMLKEVEAGASYGIVDRCVSHRPDYRYQGMPKDAFHVACSGHRTRLDNSLRSPSVGTNEKALLKQRFANIITAQSVYVQKQQKALGLQGKK
jgi:hypothetical protein